MTPTADWRPVTWPRIASRLARCLRQCHSAHDVDEDAADTGHVARDSGQTAGWMKTPLGTEVDLGAGHIVLDGFAALRERGTAPPLLGPCLLWPRSPISATAELLFYVTFTFSCINHFTFTFTLSKSN